MNEECKFCCTLKWKEEAAGMCCSGGKVALPSIDERVEPLKELLFYETDESRRFLKNIRKYNTCFHMTSFGTDDIVSMQVFCPTFNNPRANIPHNWLFASCYQYATKSFASLFHGR
ncbi:helitron_like_N domain-containing protein [Trichonephila clavipes]|nr:helitron_like_N domain-containing protein [Trichonephila clavipes]